MSQSNMKMKTECIRTGNKLLRGELSAVQTYELAMKRHPGLAPAFDLDRIANEHRRSSRLLTAAVRQMGGEPASSSAIWGLHASGVPTAATIYGAKSMVESLRRGEEQCRNDYEDALDGETTLESLKALIRSDLLTSVEDHITSLERIRKAVV